MDAAARYQAESRVLHQVPGKPHALKLDAILTLRGFAFLILCFYLLFGPVHAQNDIVASVLSFSLLGILTTLSALTVFHGKVLRNSLNLQAGAYGLNPKTNESPANSVISGRPAVIAIKVSPLSILPFFVLKLQLQFGPEKLPSAVHHLSGRIEHQKFIAEELSFPHRGPWHLAAIACSYEDRFGFAVLRWAVTGPIPLYSITVKPPPGVPTHLPILSSSIRSGESILEMNERRGEPFDLKPYHPADGIRKILWKIYAKSGELISRHPERSMTPEGQVVVFCLAAPEEDVVCSQTLAYLQQLKELDLELFVGCAGMTPGKTARSKEEAEKLFIDSVWQARLSTTASLLLDLGGLLEQVRQSLRGARIANILIFCATGRLKNRSNLEMYTTIGDFLEQQQIHPVFFMVDTRTSMPAGIKPGNESRLKRLIDRLAPYLIYPTDSTPHPLQDLYPSFLEVCAKRKWQVII